MQLHSHDEVWTETLAGNLLSALPSTPSNGLVGLNASVAISNCPILVLAP